ncbi:MAG: hypothetical protein VCD16_16630, partial [Planctomycetota bacterium]
MYLCRRLFIGPVLGLAFLSFPFRVQGEEPGGGGRVARPRWAQSYDAGYTDKGGAHAGGSEIMHLVA